MIKDKKFYGNAIAITIPIAAQKRGLRYKNKQKQMDKITCKGVWV